MFPSATVREEAAALYAAGTHAAAEDFLLSYITRCRGTCPRAIWFMLLDLYQATDQKQSFEKIAHFFANHFDTSPPAWVDRALERDAARRGAAGFNALVVDGPLHAMPADKIHQFALHARRAQMARLDLSRARLGDGEADRVRGLRALLDILRRLRRDRVPTLLMGETKLAEQMRQAVLGQIKDRAAPGEEARLAWQVLLEFLQWRAQEEAFDELADAYVLRFSESPPDYEPEGVVAIAPDDRHPATARPSATDTVDLPAVTDVAEMNALLPVMEDCLDRHGHLRLGLRHAERVSYEAGVALAAFFHARPPSAGIVLVQPSELVRALFEMTGVSGFATIEERKR